ncbi:MAG: hypothetical protein R6V06_10400 [Kiritimatiellia bacterium]
MRYSFRSDTPPDIQPHSGSNHFEKNLKNKSESSFLKYSLIILAAVSVCVVTAAFLINRRMTAQKNIDSSLTVPAEKMPVVRPQSGKSLYSNFLSSFPDNVAVGEKIRGWRYIIADVNEQTFSVKPGITGSSFFVNHTAQQRFVLESPMIPVEGSGLRHLRMKGRIRKLKDFRGNVFYQLHSYGASENGTPEKHRIDSFEVRGRSNEGDDVAAISRKIHLVKQTIYVRLRIEADFIGQLELRQPQLVGHDDSIPSTITNEGNIP